MTTSAMDPPPPRNPNRDPEPPQPNTTSISQSEESLPPAEVSSMNPPPPRNPNEPNLETTEVVEPKLIEQLKDDSVATDADKPPRARAVKQNPVPYTIPEWSGPPCHQFQLEVLKEGAIVDQLNECNCPSLLSPHFAFSFHSLPNSLRLVLPFTSLLCLLTVLILKAVAEAVVSPLVTVELVVVDAAAAAAVVVAVENNDGGIRFGGPRR